MAHKDDQEHLKDRRRHSRSDKDSDKIQKPKSLKSKVTDSESGSHTKSGKKTKDSSKNEHLKKRVSEPTLTMEDLVPELSRTSSRNSLPYPAFNKTYSKESVRVIKDNSKMTVEKSPLTPVMSDADSDKKLDAKSDEKLQTRSKGERPPSPPETDIAQQKKPPPRRMSQVREDIEETMGKNDETNPINSKLSKNEGKSKSSVASRSSLASSNSKLKSNCVNVDNFTDRGPTNGSRDDLNQATNSSEQARLGADSSSRPASTTTSISSDSPERKADSHDTNHEATAPDTTPGEASGLHDQSNSSCSQKNSPIDKPRVDYLKRNGGLTRPISKKIISHSSNRTQSKLFAPSPINIDEVFGPCHSLLDQYEIVLKKNGSLAVATGYRSVARRLLDRLEVVMGRCLSSEGCLCFMCRHPDIGSRKKPRGLGWGEVLEWSSGRKVLPEWPAFDFATLGVKALDDIISPENSQQNPTAPCSSVNLDPDIADEFRQYYLQQSKKTKLAVDRWLSTCPPAAATPPQEVDDETLSFAILTHLPKGDRSIFNTLVTGSSKLQPANRAPVLLKKPRSELISKSVLSIQRLYRLPTPPRDPEAAIFLLKYPELHNLLATMSEISTREWEILISGRFDGFLWSGADTHFTSSWSSFRAPSPQNDAPNRRKMSSDNSQFEQENFPQIRLPVLNDEETEIAVLTEIENEIYHGMEYLEDAFEALHRKAEVIRRALRERGSVLTTSLESRRSSQPDIFNEGTIDPPVPGLGVGYERPSYEKNDINYDSEWDPGDDFSELAPDDSASNIASSKKRRPKRRNERRAPVLLEEDDEE